MTGSRFHCMCSIDKPDAHFWHLGSLMRFQAKMLGSSLYLHSKPIRQTPSSAGVQPFHSCYELAALQE